MQALCLQLLQRKVGRPGACHQPLSVSPAVVSAVVHTARSRRGRKGRLCSTSVTLMMCSSSGAGRQRQRQSQQRVGQRWGCAQHAMCNGRCAATSAGTHKAAWLTVVAVQLPASRQHSTLWAASPALSELHSPPVTMVQVPCSLTASGTTRLANGSHLHRRMVSLSATQTPLN